MSVPSSELGPPTSFHASDVSPRNKRGRGVTLSPAGEGGRGSPNQFGRLEKRLSALSTLCWKAYFSPEKSGLNPSDTITSPILRRCHDFTMFFKKSKVVKERICLQENKMVVSDSINCTETFWKKLCIRASIQTWREVLGYSKNWWAWGSKKFPATFPLYTYIRIKEIVKAQ